MTTYSAPLREIGFVLHELLHIDRLSRIAPGASATADIVDVILQSAARLCEKVLFPLNHLGDEEGCHFKNGVVQTPTGFREAYKIYTEGGWTSLACDPAFGGQGLPEVLNFALAEMACSANLAFYTYPALSHAAYALINAHGSNEMKLAFLPSLVSGHWSGTMCLTEPQCGTDLGLILTKAHPQPDGTYKVNGTKIFISGGDHDLTENIIHLVLARLVGAPPGTHGLSLFLVPKFEVKLDGSLGARNSINCGSIEAKMGIHGSATCTMNFDEATAFLVGRRGRGLVYMRTMMETARLLVGVQGLGLAETAYQSARAYARERRQGRAVGEIGRHDQMADLVIRHPDIRRMLLTMKAFNEGARAFAYWVGLQVDLSRQALDPGIRRDAADQVELMTPVVKSFLTDYGFDATNLGLQILGGHGYIREHGMEQLVRDARIGPLYEGTNGIQAIDLVGKLTAKSGRAIRWLFESMDQYVDQHKANTSMQEFTRPLAKACSGLQQMTSWIVSQGSTNPQNIFAVASDYLQLFALVMLARMWVGIVEASLGALEKSCDDSFYRTKIATARFYMHYLLPRSLSLIRAMITGCRPMMEMDAKVL